VKESKPQRYPLKLASEKKVSSVKRVEENKKPVPIFSNKNPPKPPVTK
jgi:hypothetical protein